MKRILVLGLIFVLLLSFGGVVSAVHCGKDNSLFTFRVHNNGLDLQVDATITNGESVIRFFYGDGINFLGSGKSEGQQIAVADSDTLIYNLTNDAEGDEYFFVTCIYGADAYSYYVEIPDSDDANGVDFRDVISGTAIATNIKNDTLFTIGDCALRLDNFIRDQWVKIDNTNMADDTYFDRVYDTNGNYLLLPLTLSFPSSWKLKDIFDTSGSIIGRYSIFYYDNILRIYDACGYNNFESFTIGEGLCEKDLIFKKSGDVFRLYLDEGESIPTKIPVEVENAYYGNLVKLVKLQGNFIGYEFEYHSLTDTFKLVKEPSSCSLDCTESWSCTSWSSCINNQQTRTCTDSNSCGTTTNKPSLNQSCTIGECSEDWGCTNWGDCEDGEKTRICEDLNECGTTENKPSETKSCTETTTQNQEQEQQEITAQSKSYIQNKEVIIERVGGRDIINVEEKYVESLFEIVEEFEKVYVKTSEGNKEIKILPEEAIVNANKIETVREIRLKSAENGEAVYSISGTKKVRLFFIFPMSAEVRQDISIEDGEIISTKRPWWHIFAFGI